MSELRFDGRVAIVTGAGGGLGRQHALTLAARGCKVVVNDLGGSAHGAGHSSLAADQVVEEIRAMGGEAVANYDSVENGEAIVQTALDHFGTVDIVINNAGILRDVSFAKMTEQDWDLVMRVHLNGSKSVSHAAWPIMREKGYGRIIMTTSAAGIYGNFGQANYCAAKLGILGLANCLAEEGRSKNIFVNTIAPLAASRLTETVMPPELLALLKPEAVSPLVAWLCHENCKETKGLFEVGAGFIAKLRWERTLGHSFPNNREFNIDDVVARWNKITDFNESTHPDSTTESFTPILDGINHPSLGGNEFIDLDEAAKAELVLESSYDERDLSLYALGIGAARDPLDKSELKYVYELGEFAAIPTYGAMPQLNAMLAAAKTGIFSLPGMNFGFDRLLHGEQYMEIKRPLPPHAKLRHVFRFKEAFDKAPNAVVTFAISTQDESGEEIAYNEMTSFVRGAGGWGGDRGPSGEVNTPPDREPDVIIEEKTDANQTLLYRLSGDWNPLHADPDFAKAFGFEKPILHGMCTFGYCGRHVIKAFCNNDERYFKSIKVRFAKSVFPGDTLVTKMWKESDNRIIFETSVKERNEVVIKNAVVELYSEIPKAAAKPKVVNQQTEVVSQSTEPDRLIASDVFKVVADYVAQHPELVDKTKTVFLFKLKNPESVWTLDLKNGKGGCQKGETEKADVTLEMNEEHLETVVTSSLADVQKLFFGGQLKIGGNVMASNKLTVLQDINAARYQEVKQQRLASAGATTTSNEQAETAQNTEITLADVFNAVNDYLNEKGDLAEKTKTTFQFHIHNPDSNWFIDLKNGKGGAGAGDIDKPDVTLDMDEQHIPTVFGGSLADVQKLFFGGQLKIAGNVMASNKLTMLQDMGQQRVEAARDKRIASGTVSQAITANSPEPKKPMDANAVLIFAALQKQIEQIPVKTGRIQFNITEPTAQWTVDFAQATVMQGEADQADVTFSLSDSHLLEIVQGKRDSRDLYQHGELRVDGDIKLTQQLQNLIGLI
ncbi:MULTISPECIES: peroxisomal multifunctional enzyme type 2 [Acinetobacter]|uniref:SDR family NAD(P)-dependent oxidoreductase n=1 Tax=Acinetobacter corruptisaponis TaxID=3045147 RepID=A0ABY8S8F4_9GAMM|nr:peroxisomal multifunctional enzyme type 2 [Acinetobacter sp. KCTC 92772]WHP05964.1 SDR family NAD(P)-dependent oxidoreductase [Acinetobacter sp. KCTC 92772]